MPPKKEWVSTQSSIAALRSLRLSFHTMHHQHQPSAAAVAIKQLQLHPYRSMRWYTESTDDTSLKSSSIASDPSFLVPRKISSHSVSSYLLLSSSTSPARPSDSHCHKLTSITSSSYLITSFIIIVSTVICHPRRERLRQCMHLRRNACILLCSRLLFVMTDVDDDEDENMLGNDDNILGEEPSPLGNGLTFFVTTRDKGGTWSSGTRGYHHLPSSLRSERAAEGMARMCLVTRIADCVFTSRRSWVCSMVGLESIAEGDSKSGIIIIVAAGHCFCLYPSPLLWLQNGCWTVQFGRR